MRKLALLSTALLAACGVTPAPDLEIPVRGETPGFTCRSDGLDRFVGQLANVDVAAEIQRASGARSLRWTGPGMAVTMDYRPDRVNVNLDERLFRIAGISCG